MGLVRVYTKPQGQQPDFTDPVVLSSVAAWWRISAITFTEIWLRTPSLCSYGALVQDTTQHCCLSHLLQDEDVVRS
ncbi:hypothetical protein SAY86_017534 [Trapa natans]|uniref:Uncharacterized protein n=1 Tax=Trapa natans TaxID=22666 RepID=A0AAN7LQ99_TRANT|nr:hypothetical protein SAY86_017534 [Trapa natans]